MTETRAEGPRRPDSGDFALPDPDFADGFVPPDPDEPPPVELWSAVGDVSPWGTLALILSWVAVFATFAFRGQFGDQDVMLAWGASATGRPALETAWRLLASTFLHSGAAHVFFNAVSMFIFGPAVERLFTRWGFWLVFALGGAAGSLGSLVWRSYRHDGLSLSIGASGAIFALGGAVLIAAIRLRHRLAPGRARALGAALLFLLVNALVGGLARHGTDNAGHGAGLLAGLVLGAALPLSPRLGGARTGVLLRVLGTLAALALLAALAWAVRGGLSAGA